MDMSFMEIVCEAISDNSYLLVTFFAIYKGYSFQVNKKGMSFFAPKSHKKKKLRPPSQQQQNQP